MFFKAERTGVMCASTAATTSSADARGRVTGTSMWLAPVLVHRSKSIFLTACAARQTHGGIMLVPIIPPPKKN